MIAPLEKLRYDQVSDRHAQLASTRGKIYKMRRRPRVHDALLIVLLLTFMPKGFAESGEPATKVLLRHPWYIEPSSETPQNGRILSTAEFQPKHWYRATVPSTITAALVADHVFPDPYFGMNLRSIPGTSYPIGANFSHFQMPPESPFRQPWWYQTQFGVPVSYKGKRVQLHFDGINFRAAVWLNGTEIASAEKMAGTYRLFEFDVTDIVVPGKVNALAVQVFPPTPEDLSIGFVDWNPAPPDKDMGVWRDVYLTASGPVTIRFPQVITKIDLPAVDKARLTVTAEVTNRSNSVVTGILRGKIENVEFSQSVTLAGKEHKVVTFTPDRFAQLTFFNPRLWWPAYVGPQNLYHLRLVFETGRLNSDEAETTFGIREIRSEIQEAKEGARVFSGHDQGFPAAHIIFRVNGKRILIRGAAYSFDMMLRTSQKSEEAAIEYARDMNLNAIRVEGQIVDDTFLELADRYGILITAGWSCCSHWEEWKKWDEEDHVIAEQSLMDQIRRLRSHPSVFNWMNGSDSPPPPDIERRYIDILKTLNWPNPYESSAMAEPSPVSGATGLKMTGPYEYVPPSYWLLDRQHGGAHGFNTETSPGPAIPPIETLVRMIPYDHLWPINSWWDYHAGGSAFKNLNVFTDALNQRYGAATDLHDYVMKAQVMEFEGERAMFEAFGRDKYTSTGVIHWMLNNAWPSMIWHLYDYYLRPGGSYFGAKKGCEPLHIQYSYDDRSIAVVNSYYTDFTDLKATAQVYNLDLTEEYSHEASLDIAADGVRKLFVIPDIDGLSTTYFLSLTLRDSSGKQISSNFYWLSTKPDVFDWDSSTWYFTPTKALADLTALNTLPKVKLNVTSKSDTDGDYGTTHVTIENPTKTLAFAVHLKLMKPSRYQDPEADSDEIEVLPVLWEDNYFPLMPGEKREIAVKYKTADTERESRSSDVPLWAMKRGAPTVDVDGWNVLPSSTAAPVQ